MDIRQEQLKAQEEIKKQGLRVLVCAGTGCVANGSLSIIEKFKRTWCRCFCIIRL